MFLLFIWFLFYTNTNNNIILSEKHCVNCKHFVKNTFCHDTFGKCSAFRRNNENHYIDFLISGKEKIEYKYCSSAREDNKLCGPEGKLYMEKSNFYKDFIQPFLSTIHNRE
jgi:hypothetical protein